MTNSPASLTSVSGTRPQQLPSEWSKLHRLCLQSANTPTPDFSNQTLKADGVWIEFRGNLSSSPYLVCGSCLNDSDEKVPSQPSSPADCCQRGVGPATVRLPAWCCRATEHCSRCLRAFVARRWVQLLAFSIAAYLVSQRESPRRYSRMMHRQSFLQEATLSPRFDTEAGVLRMVGTGCLDHRTRRSRLRRTRWYLWETRHSVDVGTMPADPCHSLRSHPLSFPSQSLGNGRFPKERPIADRFRRPSVLGCIAWSWRPVLSAGLRVIFPFNRLARVDERALHSLENSKCVTTA